MTQAKKIINTITNQNCRLSVQISLTGLSFLVSSLEGLPIYFLEKKLLSSHTPEELLIELINCLSSQEELQGKFKEVTLIYTTNNYSLVPSTLFDESKASEYLKFNTKILSNDFISYDEIENQNAVVVYVPFVNINNYVFDTYGTFQYYHASSLLLKGLLSKEKHSSNTKVFIHVLAGQFECIVIEKGKLILCNSYQYTTPADFIYYILFCFEQLQLNPDTIETKVFGTISEKDELFSILYTYVRNIDFLDHVSPILSNEEKHQYYLLKSSL